MRFAGAALLAWGFLGGQAAVAQIPNGEFDNSLAPWWTLFENSPYASVEPGTWEWDSAYGGSAYLTVSGAPGGVGLLTFIDENISAGDTIRTQVYHSDFVNFAGITLFIGGYAYCGQSAEHQDPGPGPCQFDIVTDKDYACGTPV